jgi:AbrB family looped-hinge helix DNA binding protein
LIITIPAETARQLGVQEGDRMIIETKDDEITLRPARSLRDLAAGWRQLGSPQVSRLLAESIRTERDEHAASR